MDTALFSVLSHPTHIKHTLKGILKPFPSGGVWVGFTLKALPFGRGLG